MSDPDTFDVDSHIRSEEVGENAKMTVHICGPGTARCACACPDGPCDHRWDGAWIDVDEQESTATCSRCGMSALSHGLWVAP